jgi:hypothetical protein
MEGLGDRLWSIDIDESMGGLKDARKQTGLFWRLVNCLATNELTLRESGDAQRLGRTLSKDERERNGSLITKCCVAGIRDTQLIPIYSIQVRPNTRKLVTYPDPQLPLLTLHQSVVLYSIDFIIQINPLLLHP